MDFRTVLEAAGMRPREVIDDGRIRRCSTDHHPRKRNGWYVLHPDGRGAWGDWSDESRRGTWRDGTAQMVSDAARERTRAAREHARNTQRAERRHAAETARAMLAKAAHAPHAYLAAKGFPDTPALTLEVRETKLLLVPMYVDKRLVGVQMIDEHGTKKFLRGQLTGGATFTIGKGEPVWCEGYATGLSIAASMRAARLTRSVVVCFSAHNLQILAKHGAVVADNDESGAGQRAAEATGLPYWISDRVGEDFNDHCLRVGPFRAAMALKQRLMEAGR